jgi:DNA-binding transcriptional LysR family regulator
VLTPAGEVMLAYARRLLALNDEAVQAVQGKGWSKAGYALACRRTLANRCFPPFWGSFPVPIRSSGWM